MRYINNSGILVYIPPVPKVSDDYVPYIFSDMELNKIFTLADNIHMTKAQPNPYIQIEYPLVLRLMYGCGLRIGETLALKMKDVDLEGGVLILRHTKGNKQRLVPMHSSLASIMNNYCMIMGFVGNPEALLFPDASSDVPMSTNAALHKFESILKLADIFLPGRKKYQRGPCMHCFRHVFTFKSFMNAEKVGHKIDDSVPYLSIYLGHDSLRETEKYLKFNSEMYPNYLIIILLKFSQRWIMKNKPSGFLELLNIYISSYLPCSIGASPNTVKSYKYAFRLLIEFMYNKKGIKADSITFEQLDYDTLMEFFLWIEEERGCSASTKNQRLSAISAFSGYAQNRDFAAAAVFRNSINKIPIKKAKKKQRAVFTQQEVSVFLRTPDDSRETGLRDKVLLSLMYASGARAQEMCDLTVGNIQFNPKRTALNIKGKGGKIRRIGIPDSCAEILKQYLIHRRVVDVPEKHVFSSQTHEQLTISCIEAIFKKYVKIAKKENSSLFREDSYPPHSMRHYVELNIMESECESNSIQLHSTLNYSP